MYKFSFDKLYQRAQTDGRLLWQFKTMVSMSKSLTKHKLSPAHPKVCGRLHGLADAQSGMCACEAWWQIWPLQGLEGYAAQKSWKHWLVRSQVCGCRVAIIPSPWLRVERFRKSLVVESCVCLSRMAASLSSSAGSVRVRRQSCNIGSVLGVLGFSGLSRLVLLQGLNLVI